ncbi:MAG TPA: OmpH family outer membrane protein [Gammaproteobacteria bacterium]|nr:OmpH family outer membrane protein [Gammaproteobacteria bacterium]
MRHGFLAAALVAAGLFVFSSAQAASAGPKIAVVDVQAVITNSHRGQEAKEALQSAATQYQTQAGLDDKRKKALALKDQLDKTDSKSANYKKLLTQYQDSYGELQQGANEIQQLLQKRQQELLQPIEQELQTVIAQYVKDNGIDILLNKGASVISASDAYDVTTSVTEALDKDWAQLQKTSAPAASTKAGH